jgi:hypothetical protein
MLLFFSMTVTPIAQENVDVDTHQHLQHTSYILARLASENLKGRNRAMPAPD